ncbi:hypothetical protein [Flagellimonas allohymeniacidonis]|uniref:Uncharacterized protein n=1 Tax=Flagellimonas allohymeniacidonis TaxID=2517819 RepID=A0A4Q8QLE1_9FLAO|nr:hypothetical protein [Allomuricauda hymeniacidonis]TAI49076.1 hypothetical protein EW142_04590 [Allomuricauda hymeniacidonis]
MIPKDFDAFQETLDTSAPSKSWSLALQSLWWDAKGDWNASHNIAQDLNTDMGSWIHAYLHRKEGDDWNAGYWYRRAGQPFPKISLEAELKQLVEAALSS